ncbi:MAG: PQQ-binding-like beta-propeller repeat protein [Phycisphaerae bacterium]|nr:PQQ-binding-like beta-propeller repeat protein [Phycisphaerae bacterium]
MRIAFTILCLLTFATGALAAPATQPASQPDWPAFHGGGPLLGVAPAAPAPPLKLRWTYRVDKAGFANSAAIVGDTVYIADDTHSVHAINLKTGERRWAFRGEDGFAAAPLVAGGRVFVGDKHGLFRALDAATGRELWKYDSEDIINSSPNLTPDGNVVFANDGGRVACLDAAKGKEIWKLQIAQTNGAVAVDGSVGWVASCDRTLRSIDLKDGTVLQEVGIDRETGAAPAVTEQGVVVGTAGAKVWCIEPNTGRKTWTYEQMDEETMVYSSAACADGLVVVGARDNNVHAIDAKTGKRKWVFQTQGEVDSSPAIGAGRVYVGSGDGKFYVLELKTGKELWHFEAGKPITAGPAIAHGVVVVGDDGGRVYCFEAKNGT